MPRIAGQDLDADGTGALLDLPVLVSDSVVHAHRRAYLNPEHAASAGVAVETLTPGAIWTVLRELPPGTGLVVDPEMDEEVEFAPDEVDVVLGLEPGQARADVSLLSRRRRAELRPGGSCCTERPRGSPSAPSRVRMAAASSSPGLIRRRQPRHCLPAIR